MRKIIQLILLAILSGCATTQNYELVLSSWVGRDEIELIRGWGPPRQTYESAGSKFLVYFSSRNVFLPGTSPTVTTTLVGNTAYTNSIGGSPNMNVGMTCQTTFESVHSRIVSWSWKGNDCKALTAEKVSEKIKSTEESLIVATNAASPAAQIEKPKSVPSEVAEWSDKSLLSAQKVIG